jgi:hypothetical protein
MESFSMSSVTNIVAGRLGLAALAGLVGRPVASPSERRAPSSYGMTRLGIVPSDEDLAPLPVPVARPAMPTPPAEPAAVEQAAAAETAAVGETPAAIGQVGPCGAGILSAQPDAGKMPAPQADARTTCSYAGTDQPDTPGAVTPTPTPTDELRPSCQASAGSTALAVRWNASANSDALVGPCASQSGVGAPLGLAAALHMGPAAAGASSERIDQSGSIQPPPAPAAADPLAAHAPAPAEAQALTDAASKRRTFRLPARLANCLKAYAVTTGQFQYKVAAEALRQFLEGAVPALGFARRARLAELQSRLGADTAGPPPAPSSETPAAPQTAEIPGL